MTTSEREEVRKYLLYLVTCLIAFQFQQARVLQFCTKYHYSPTEPLHRPYFVMLNEKKRTAYCFSPKVGCTNVKNAFLRAQGAVIKYILN